MSATLRLHNAQPLNVAVRVTLQPSGEVHTLSPGEALPFALAAGQSATIEPVPPEDAPAPAETPVSQASAPAARRRTKV